MNSYVTGGTIKALREGRGLTQKTLADRIGVSDKAVSKWETGRGLPDLSLLEPLGEALGVSVAELLSGEPNVNYPNTLTTVGKGFGFVFGCIRSKGRLMSNCKPSFLLLMSKKYDITLVR